MSKINIPLLAEEMKKKGYGKGASIEFIKDLFNTIVELVVDGHEVVIINFGKFALRNTAGRTINLHNKSQEIPPSISIKYKPSVTLKKGLNHETRIKE